MRSYKELPSSRPKAVVPDIYTVYQQESEQAELFRKAETLLRAVRAGAIQPGELDFELFTTPEVEQLLTTPDKRLGGLSPMAAIRRRIETHPYEETPRHEAQPASSTGRRVGGAEASGVHSRAAPDDSPPARRAFVSATVGFSNIHEGTRSIHLSGQEVVNLSTVQEILDLCPDLAEIQLTQSDKRLVGRGILGLLEQRGIKLRYGREREAGNYDVAPVTEEYLRKKTAFEAMLADPEKSLDYEIMRRLEFDEAEIAQLYFGEERISVGQILERMGLKESTYVREKFDGFMHWMGYNFHVRGVIRRAKYLQARLDWLKAAEIQLPAREALRRKHRVGTELPPVHLNMGRWEMWQRLKKVTIARPDAISAIARRDPRTYAALTAYFMLDDTSTTGSLKEVGEEYDVSGERMRQLKNRALEKLGLLNEDGQDIEYSDIFPRKA